MRTRDNRSCLFIWCARKEQSLSFDLFKAFDKIESSHKRNLFSVKSYFPSCVRNLFWVTSLPWQKVSIHHWYLVSYMFDGGYFETLYLLYTLGVQNLGLVGYPAQEGRIFNSLFWYWYLVSYIFDSGYFERSLIWHSYPKCIEINVIYKAFIFFSLSLF